jgi:hypothetical protein
MKKSNFIALIFGTVGGVLFSLGMCMALLPEWNAFWEGVAFGGVGLLIGLITLIAWCKAEKKKMPAVNGKNLFRILYSVFSVLVFGTGICLCLVWQKIIWGTLVGLLGIVLLIGLIPLIKGIR